VIDTRTIFSRAIGLHSLFEELAPFDVMSSVFLTNYHRYADHLYACHQGLNSLTVINSNIVQFELYGSAEYSQKLSEQFERAE